MQAYLAEKYMSGPKADAILSRAAPKKKKRKAKADAPETSAAAGARLVDEDAGWGVEGKDEEAGDDIADAVVAKDRAFKKRRVGDAESNWATIQEGIKAESPPPDEQPLVVGEESFTGGLMTAEQLRKSLAQGKRKEAAISAEEQAAAQETVYRDASGKKIDTKAEKAEAARKKREKEEREAAKMEWGKGLVQREEQEKRRLEMERNRTKEFSRYADDKDLNEDLKAQERWNDPAAAFLTKKTSKGPRKPQYNGPPPPPNRFGIKPGYRWDGVDRGNGFEKKLFQRSNERKRKGAESYSWSVDDM